MNIGFEIPHDIEQQIRTEGADLNRDAKEVYLMEQFRQAKLSHRQLEDASRLELPRDRGAAEAARVGAGRRPKRV